MTEQQHLTHIDEKGDVRMVDVSEKDITKRVAVAEGFISMHPDTLALIVEDVYKRQRFGRRLCRGGERVPRGGRIFRPNRRKLPGGKR